MIGIGITTRNRNKQVSELIESIKKYTDIPYKLIVVDDNSKIPINNSSYRFVSNVGVAVAKNKCFELLDDCEDIFLLDDDVLIISNLWYKPILDSGLKHAIYQFNYGKSVLISEDKNIENWSGSSGCLLYYKKICLGTVGGMNPKYGLWGIEHKELSDRIYNAGLTPYRYPGIKGLNNYIKSLDEDREIESTVDSTMRWIMLDRNRKIYNDFKDTNIFIPYKEGAMKHSDILWSICVLSVESRYKTFLPKIMENLFSQYNMLSMDDRNRITINIDIDTGYESIGNKRNSLIKRVNGQYVSFVDDDDIVANTYIQNVLDILKTKDVDCVTFQADVSLNGELPKKCHYSKEFNKDYNTEEAYYRIPNHLCVIKRNLCELVGFSDMNVGEDSEFSKRMLPYLKTEYTINKVLYTYNYNDLTTTSQIFNRYSNSKTSILDIIILSNASTDELRKSTENTIESINNTIGNLKVNILVIEQNEEVSYNVKTIHNTSEFNFNKFANQGIQMFNSEWVMVANNDLQFTENWLHNLLKVNYPVTSPKCSWDTRQKHITNNEKGYTNGVHLSGWCFMLKRSVWESIGGFDESVNFWCSDDAFIEQLKKISLSPMVVPSSVVNHYGSKTLKTLDKEKKDILTIDQVKVFNKKYNQNKFGWGI